MKKYAEPGRLKIVRLVILSCSALFLLAAWGCGNGGAAPPTGEVARAALEQALETCAREGNPADWQEWSRRSRSTTPHGVRVRVSNPTRSSART